MVAGDVIAASPEPAPSPGGGAPGTPEPLGYRPALDGLRAIAAGSVLLYHGGVSWSSGGFLGVDVFFVLSGFLITALLLTEWERTGGIAILSFYGRRLRRLLPALLLVIAAVALYAVVLAPASEVHELRGDLFSTFGYFTNWRLVTAHRGYFEAFNAPSPLQHTWSLAVEEQWYLVWPIVVVGLLKLTRRANRDLRPALVVVAALCLASTVWMAVLYRPGQDPSRVYYGTDTRAQELLAGALLAFVCVVARRYTLRSPWRGVVGVGGALALAWACYLFAVVDDRTQWLYRGGMLLFSFAVVAVILAAIQPRGLLPSVLSIAPLRALGIISYGLYLWHWPIYVAVNSSRTGLDGTALLLLRLALTLAVATASYHLVERPIRRRTFSLRTIALAVPAVVVSTVALILVTTTATAPPAATAAASAAGAGATGGATGGATATPAGASGSSLAGYRLPQQLLDDPATGRIVVTGDSVALNLSFGFRQGEGDPRGLLLDKSMPGCPLFDAHLAFDGPGDDYGPQCPPWWAQRDQWLAEFHPDLVAVLAGVWDVYDRTVDGRRLTFGSPAFDAWYSRELDAFIAQMHSGGARVALLTVPCNERAEPVNGPEPPENDGSRVDHLNDLYRQAARRHPDSTSVIDLHGFLCPGGHYRSELHGVALRADGVHLTGAGADAAWKWMLPQVDTLLAAQVAARRQ